MKMISTAHGGRNTIHSDMKAIVISWHGSAVNKTNDFASILSMLLLAHSWSAAYLV